MGNKDNFNQAMSEIFPFRKNKESGGAEAEQSGQTAGPAQQGQPGASGVSGGAVQSNLAENRDPQSGVVDFQSAYEAKVLQSIETTRITKDTKITGTIVSKSHLDIGGDVYGDVESQNNIFISGKVEGNINGKSVEINRAKVKGDVRAGEHLSVADHSEIMGNLFAGELDFNSKISGSITVKKGINIYRDSAIVGDITAASVNIESGAVLKSMMNITGERKEAEEE